MKVPPDIKPVAVTVETSFGEEHYEVIAADDMIVAADNPVPTKVPPDITPKVAAVEANYGREHAAVDTVPTKVPQDIQPKYVPSQGHLHSNSYRLDCLDKSTTWLDEGQ
jgi:hypothetical protein